VAQASSLGTARLLAGLDMELCRQEFFFPGGEFTDLERQAKFFLEALLQGGF
jgi:hypothetical protein